MTYANTKMAKVFSVVQDAMDRYPASAASVLTYPQHSFMGAHIRGAKPVGLVFLDDMSIESDIEMIRNAKALKNAVVAVLGLTIGPEGAAVLAWRDDDRQLHAALHTWRIDFSQQDLRWVDIPDPVWINIGTYKTGWRMIKPDGSYGPLTESHDFHAPRFYPDGPVYDMAAKNVEKALMMPELTTLYLKHLHAVHGETKPSSGDHS